MIHLTLSPIITSEPLPQTPEPIAFRLAVTSAENNLTEFLSRLNTQFDREPTDQHIIYPANGSTFDSSADAVNAIDVTINPGSNLAAVREWFSQCGASITLGTGTITYYEDDGTLGYITTTYEDDCTLGYIASAEWLRTAPPSDTMLDWERIMAEYAQENTGTRQDTGAAAQTFRPRNLLSAFETELEPPLPTLTEYMNTLNEDRKKSTVEGFKQRVTNIQAEHGGASQEKCIYTHEDIILNKNSSEANNQKFIMILDSHNNFMFFFSAPDILSDLHTNKINPNGRQRMVAIAEGTFAELLDLMKNHVPESDKGDPFWQTGVATLEATPGSPTNKPH